MNLQVSDSRQAAANNRPIAGPAYGKDNFISEIPTLLMHGAQEGAAVPSTSYCKENDEETQTGVLGAMKYD